MHFTDYTLIFLLALVLFGPKKLPEIGRQIGKLMVEFRRASNEFKSQIDEELRNMEMQERQKKYEAESAAAQTPALSAPEAPELTTPNAPPEFDGLPEPEADIEADYSATWDEGDEEIQPVILPPSTGEPVPAASPYGRTSSQEELSDVAAIDSDAVYEEAIAANGPGEHAGASPSYMPVAPQELLDAAAIAPHPVYAEALAAEQNGNSHPTGPAPENSQAAVNHG